MDKFYAGTKSEILSCSRRGMQHFHLKYLLAHQGEFHILADGIMLGDWRTVFFPIAYPVPTAVLKP